MEKEPSEEFYFYVAAPRT